MKDTMPVIDVETLTIGELVKLVTDEQIRADQTAKFKARLEAKVLDLQAESAGLVVSLKDMQDQRDKECKAARVLFDERSKLLVQIKQLEERILNQQSYAQSLLEQRDQIVGESVRAPVSATLPDRRAAFVERAVVAILAANVEAGHHPPTQHDMACFWRVAADSWACRPEAVSL